MLVKLEQVFFIFILGAFIVLSHPLHAQDYAKDMQKIAANYSNKKIQFHIRYSFFPDSLALASDSMQVYCVLDGNNYYYKIHSGGSEFEYIKNNTYSIVIDHLQKAIALSKSTQAPPPTWNAKEIDSLMHTPAVKIQYQDKGSQEGEYEISLAKGTWNHLRIVFNKTSYTIRTVIMHSSAKGKLVGQKFNKPTIVMSYYEYGNPTDESCFSESTYFSSTGDPVVLKPAYKRYKLLDYIHNSSN